MFTKKTRTDSEKNISDRMSRCGRRSGPTDRVTNTTHSNDIRMIAGVDCSDRHRTKGSVCVFCDTESTEDKVKGKGCVGAVKAWLKALNCFKCCKSWLKNRKESVNESVSQQQDSGSAETEVVFEDNQKPVLK